MNKYSYENFNPYIISIGGMTRKTCPSAGTVFQERVVKWYEIELIHYSDKGYIITNGEKLLAKKGNIFYRKPGMVVQGVAAYHCTIIIFDSIFDVNNMNFYNSNDPFENPTNLLLETMYDKASKTDFLNKLPYRTTVEDYGYYNKIMKDCFQSFIKNDEDFQLIGKTYLYSILNSLLAELQPINTRKSNMRSISSNYDNIMELKDYIDNNFKKRITLKQLSKMFNLSPNFLCKIFKEIVGKSPIDYLVHLRISKAKEMLLNTIMPINEIAYACGFDNDTYFYTLFRKKVGLTPTSYRQQYGLYQQHG